MSTPRKRIAEALEREPLDLRELSKMFGLKERDVLDHLDHIARSARPKRFIIEPASCLHCGFSFRKRSRMSTPGRCPICKSQSIAPPRYQIV